MAERRRVDPHAHWFIACRFIALVDYEKVQTDAKPGFEEEICRTGAVDLRLDHRLHEGTVARRFSFVTDRVDRGVARRLAQTINSVKPVDAGCGFKPGHLDHCSVIEHRVFLVTSRRPHLLTNERA